MGDLPVHEEFLDVLQNIEVAVMRVYKEYPGLADYDVQSAYEALIKDFAGEDRGREPVPPRNPNALKVYEAVKVMCEWRLGRTELSAKKGRHSSPRPEPISVSDIIACLKWLRKSVETWNKQGGRQGYLNYISQFLE